MSDITETAVYIKDAAGNFLYVNDVFAKLLFRSSAAEVVGRACADFFSPEAAKVLREEEDEILSSGVPRDFERKISDSEGRKFVYVFRKFPIELGGDKGIFCTGEREDPSRALPVSEEARQRFFSALSHDLRTPLNAIVGYAQVLQNDQNPASCHEAAKAIGEGSRSLLSAVDGLMTLLGSGDTTKPPTYETFNVSEATLAVTESYAEAAGRNNVELCFKSGKLPLVEFAGSVYKDILGRLLEYAVRRTPAGIITVKTAYADSVLQLSVTDMGRKLKDFEIAQVTNPTEDELSGGPRSGSATLSLAAAKCQAERLNGSIVVANEAGNVGVTVTVTFQGVKATDGIKRAEFARTQKMRTMRIEDPFRYEKRILLVDDRAVNLRIMSLLLGAMGFRNVTTALSGEQALEHVRKQHFHCVLTDLMMPGMDGRELLQEIRRVPGRERLPVYVVTADTSATVTCANDGFSGILIKPVTKDMLKEVL